MPQQHDLVRRLCANDREFALLAATAGLGRALFDEIADRAVADALAVAGGKEPRTAGEFEALVDSSRQHVADCGAEVVRVGPVSAAGGEGRACRARWAGRAGVRRAARIDRTAARRHCSRRAGCVTRPSRWFHQLPKYVRAVARRAERVRDDVERDRKLAGAGRAVRGRPARARRQSRPVEAGAGARAAALDDRGVPGVAVCPGAEDAGAGVGQAPRRAAAARPAGIGHRSVGTARGECLLLSVSAVYSASGFTDGVPWHFRSRDFPGLLLRGALCPGSGSAGSRAGAVPGCRREGADQGAAGAPRPARPLGPGRQCRRVDGSGRHRAGGRLAGAGSGRSSSRRSRRSRPGRYASSSSRTGIPITLAATRPWRKAARSSSRRTTFAAAWARRSRRGYDLQGSAVPEGCTAGRHVRRFVVAAPERRSTWKPSTSPTPTRTATRSCGGTRPTSVHLGDLFYAGGYPFIDLGSGGSLAGVVAAIERCSRVRTRRRSSSRATARSRTAPNSRPIATCWSRWAAACGKLVEDGTSEEQILASHPTAEFDERYGKGAVDAGPLRADALRRSRRRPLTPQPDTSKLMPCASGRSLPQLTVQVCRRM